MPLTDDLLPQAAALFKSDTPGLFERVKGYSEDIGVDLNGAPTASEFSKLCTYIEFVELREYGGGERWSQNGCKEKLALKFYLSKVVQESCPHKRSIPKTYLDFAEGLTCYDIVVTFNWDTLLESAILATNKRFTYIFEENCVPIVKLHGSANWVNGAPNLYGAASNRFEYAPIGTAEGIMQNEIYSSNCLIDKNIWRYARALGEVEPLIVLPGYGKGFDVRNLSYFWYRPEFFSLRKGGVSVIGLSVSDDDFFIESFFYYFFNRAHSPKTIMHILNPDPTVGERFTNLAGEHKLIIRTEKFEESTLDFALCRDGE